MSAEGRKARAEKLDKAIHEYVDAAVADGEIEEGVLLTGWIAGFGLSHYVGEDIIDGMMVEHTPLLNSFTAAGLSAATAKALDYEPRISEEDDG